MSHHSSYSDLVGGSDFDSSLGGLYPAVPAPSAWTHVVPPPGDPDGLYLHPLADLERPSVLSPIKGSPATKGRPVKRMTDPSDRELNLALKLKSRLYDKPENSQVLLAVKKVTDSKGTTETKVENGSHNGTTIVPRPPSGKATGIGPGFRTTLFKKDVQRKQRIRKEREVAKGLCIKGLTKEVEVTSNEQRDERNGAARAEKTVTFADDVRSSSRASTSSSASSKSEQDREIEHKPEESASSKITKPDNSLGLEYTKKNHYDDAVLDQDDFVRVLLEKRRKLGWPTELPRHGPGCKKALEKLFDNPLGKHEIKNDEDSDSQTMQSATEDDGSFVYALPRNRKDKCARYNPYDLQIVSTNAARSCTVFWTASASNISLNIQHEVEEMIQTPTMEWLWEHRLFHKIHHLPVFHKYRLWKAFTIWKLNCRRQKNENHSAVMTKRLFPANQILQGCLLHVRGLCEAASGSLTGFGESDAAVSLIRLTKTKTMTLEDFMNVQGEQGDVALSQLKALKEQVVALVWEACATVAEMEGITHGIRSVSPVDEDTNVEAKKPEEPKAKTNARSRLLGKYGFTAAPTVKEEKKKSNKPSFAQIAEWRKILNRLSYFLRLVDYVLMELLRRLVITATHSLKQFIQASAVAEGMEDDDERPGLLRPKKILLVIGDEEIKRKSLPDNQSVGSDTDTSRASTPYKHAQSPSKFSSSTSVSSASQNRYRGREGPNATNVNKAYVIPKFNFDKVEDVEEPLDIDGVLEEVRHQHDVVEIHQPVLSVQLVLNVPPLTPVQSAQPKSSRDMSRATRQTQNSRKTGQTTQSKKAVKFTDRKDSSDDSEYEESDGSSSEEEEEESRTQTSAATTKFAYSEGRQSSKPEKASSKAFITLSPSEFQIKYGIRGIISGFEQIVAQTGTLLKEPRLEVFYTPPKHDRLRGRLEQERLEEELEEEHPWPDVALLFGEDPNYQDLINDIMETVSASVEDVNEYSNDFNQYCTMVDQARKVNVEGSMSKKQWSTDEFQKVLAVHTEQVTNMNLMVKKARLGIFFVGSETFCEACLPFPKSVLHAVFSRLPVIAAKRNEDLLTIIKGASKKLDKFPASVEEFVEHLSFLGKMSSEMPALEREYAIVTKLYTIAKDFEQLDINPEELALYQTLAPSFQHLKSTILYAEAKKDDNIRKFSTDLDRLIHDIRYKILEIKNRVRDPMLLSGDTMAVVALEKVTYMTEEVTSLSTKARSYANYQERFGSSLTSSKKNFSEEFLLADRKEGDNSAQEIQADLSEIERDLTLRRLLWESQEEWDRLAHDWTTSPFDALNVDNLQKNVNRFTQTVYMLEKGLPGNEVVPRLKEKVTDFKQVMPCVTSLRNPSLKARHWEQIEKIIGRAIVREKSFTLGNLLEMNIIKHKDKIQDISTTASNEATLERMLQKVIDLWKATDFRLVPHTGTNMYIVAGADDILAQLEESQVTIGTIRGSRYVTPIKGLVEEWERKLQLFARTLDEWMTCQRNWLYLEQIFTTPDIQRQLPAEWKMFAQVDKAWKDIMRRTEDRPNALKSATAPGVLEMLQSANSNLEKIQKCLEDYLEMKRLAFARFYFLSNDELLDILAQSKNPEAVQPHLGKCFGNIKSLEIKQLPRQPPTVRSITSAEGESIGMPKNVRARGVVEQWLCSVESGMFDTVKKHLKMGLQDWIGINFDEWVLKHPGQVVLTVIMFNKLVVQCFIHANPLTHLAKVRDTMIDNLNALAGLVSANLQPHKRMSINALLTVNVHNRDIIVSMIDNKIARRDDFEWTRQLRYEWDEQSNNCNVMQSNACFVYGYEYLGCSPRLVITPLTDRCYLTLTGALHLHLGGSPAGPAGTGKTETVKDLAKAVGKQCVVFNCSEGLDFKTLGKFFSGLAQSGSWCCFDEFNRIDLEVLSVVAQQIHNIKVAKDQRAPRFLFEGRDIRLNMTCGVFITMNPSYAGRVELPDNLKSLFRQVAMMVPDYALIAEIMLFSEGFTAAKSLSTKIVNLYQLASKQLSQQNHYDFGMRAIKSVLVMAGQRKRSVKLRSESIRSSVFTPSDEMPSDERQAEEAHILIHALRDANMPKFLAEDVPLFKSILEDLFPGIKPPQQDHGVLEKAISMAIRDQGLQHWPSQIEKVKQLHSQILVRHGVMLVGPTGGGKTTSRNILQRAMVLLPSLSLEDEDFGEDGSSLHRRQSVFIHNRGKKGHVDTFTVNPKCVTMGELYGETDPNTFEWSDGLISTATRRFAREMAAMSPDESIASRPASGITALSAVTGVSTPSQSADSPAPPSEVGDIPSAPSEVGSTAYGDNSNAGEGRWDAQPTDWKWIILDGPVDTIWVENLNTVLDDSKILCLANGERVSLSPGMRLMFEVDDLAAASPATISRCAMVYMEPVDLGWKPYVRTWLSRLPRDIPESGRAHLLALFEHSLDRGLNFVQLHAKLLTLPTPNMAIIQCLCSILTAFFDFLSKNGGFGKPDVKPQGRSQSPDSESSPSRNSSRPSSRTDKSSKYKKKLAKKKETQRMKEEMQSTAEKIAKSQSGENNKQYFLQRNPGSLNVLVGKLFVFAFTWSFGGNFRRQDEMDDDGGISRKGADKKEVPLIDIASEFDNFVHELFEIEPPLGVRMPASSRTIYSYFVDMDSGNFLPWEKLVSTTQSLIEKGAVITIGESMGVSSGESHSRSQDGEIVPTVDTVRYSFLTALLLLNKNPVLLTGESGVGKTAIIKDMLKSLEKEGGTTYKNGTILGSIFNFTDKNQTLLDNISSLTRLGGDNDEGDKGLESLLGIGRAKPVTGIVSSHLQFSAQTTANRTQLALTHKVIKKGRHTLAAPKGKKVLVFVDDLNMPQPETYGAQPPLELLRQFMDLGGFYDTKKLMWKDILDVTLVAACGPTGGGRNHVSPRLLKHFCMLALPQPSTRSLQHIYQVQLGRFFQDGEFMPEVKESLFPLVSASIAIYYRMISSMRPTPAKMHYSFNIRDLSQVIRGLLQADEGVIVNQDNCAQLFAHEATRVFHDRLVNDDDRKIFYQMLSDNLHDYFKAKWSAEKLMNEPFLFCDFTDTGGTMARVYRPINDRAKLTSILEELYMRQNIGNTQAPQLVFFHEAVEHILRVARVFRQPGGHVLMVGLDGTGKSTTVQLACYITKCELYKLTLTRGYNIGDFREDLKKVCRMAGVQGTNTVFLLTDGDIVKESFLEDINCVLNSGEVPDLFDNEEMDGISMELKSAAAEAQISDTRAEVYNFFIRRVKKYLHIVLTMSPAGNKFRHRCRMNPSLINCCTIDWFNEWSREACLSVAQVYFQNADFMCEDDQEIKEFFKDTDFKLDITPSEEDIELLKCRVAEVCVDMHVSVSVAVTRFWEEVRRRYYITPSSYMELIRLYSRMLHDQKSEFMKNRQRLLIGLMRLSEANSLVGTMQEELVALGPKIEEKRKDTEMLLAQLEKDQEAVDQVREIVAAEEQVMKRETQIVQDYADECQRDLASVLPVLQGAIASLDALDKADISEIRMYQRPPELVIIVISAVNVLLQEKPDWATAKQVLSDPQFLKRLINYDKNAIPEKVFSRLKKFSGHPDFTPDKVGGVSEACRSMCQWVLALEHYHEVYKMAKPKQRRVQEAKEAVKLAQHKLALKQASLAKIEEHLRMLSQQYEDSVNQREALKERKKTTALRLQRASVLIEALSGEKVRWAELVKVLDFKLKGLVGDTLVSAGVVAYLGAFSHQYRRNVMSSWVKRCEEEKIPISENYDFVRSMVDANQVLRWHNEGLPQDTHSTENAIIVKKSRRWPLLIDPQGQACKWIQEMEGNKLRVVQASDPNYMRTMERGIRVGDPVLLQDVTEDLDPSLKPILLQEMTVRGGHQIIRLGDTEIEYNQNFRLYMTTAMGNPHFLPAVCIQVTLINFIVTFDGLQEQLLSSVVRQERPHLETERSQLLSSIANDLQLLRDLEDKTLSLLQKTEGHILDDQDLVETLQRSKGMSGEIHERVAQSELTEKSLSVARKKYLPVAIRGAVLYFILADLANVDVMYQFSLEYFQEMFVSCINVKESKLTSPGTPRLSGTLRPSSARRDSQHVVATPRSGDVDMTPEQLQEHMQNMIDRLTWNIYRVVSVALFAHHQLTFSFMITTAILIADKKFGETDGGIEQTEFNTFLQGSIMASLMNEETLEQHQGLTPMQVLEVEAKNLKVNTPKWINSSKWRQCQHLEASFEAFSLLCRSVVTNHFQWDTLAVAEDPFSYLGKAYNRPKEDPELTEEGWESVIFPWEQLTTFQRILLLKVLRPDTLMASVRQFVELQMGAKFVSSGTLDLREMYESSSAKTPLIFILSPGSDPGAQLLRFAKELRGSTLHLDMISLGRGQGPKAEELIAKAQILKGRWVFLQNCHLAASWMPRLQTIVDRFNKPGADVDPQFRLWLSSKPDPHFPISILQTGLKMTVEPPQGVKNNLLRLFSGSGTGTINEKMYTETCPDKPAWRNLLIGLCFFNAVIHERKKYDRLGWNIPYEFNDSDLEVSVLQLQMLLEEQEDIPWPALWYLTGEVTYGGRVTDDMDRRCLHRLLQKFYHPRALEKAYTYSPDKIYHPLPTSTKYADVKGYIEQLPASDSPELFGMNENAEKAFLESQANMLIETVLSVQPRVSTSMLASGGRSSDEVVNDLALDILRVLPEMVELEDESPQPVRPGQIPRPTIMDIINMGSGLYFKLKKRDSAKHTKTSSFEENSPGVQAVKRICKSALFVVLRQEMDRFNNLLHMIHKSLRHLLLGVKGEVVMSQNLEEGYNAMLKQRVPLQWKNASYESCKPLGQWISDLVQRVDFFSSWVDLVTRTAEKALKGSTAMNQQQSQQQMANQDDPLRLVEDVNNVQPSSFWLSAFFFPQGFLTAVQQNHARKVGVSVDSLTFNFNVINRSIDSDDSLTDTKRRLDVKSLGFNGGNAPENGVMVFGLHLDGARWNLKTNTLCDSLPGQRFSHLPQIHFLPVIEQCRQTASSALESPLAMFKTRSPDSEDTHDTYECPLYRTSTRAGTLSSTGHSTNFVTSISLPTDKPAEFWVMRGVALLCQLDD